MSYSKEIWGNTVWFLFHTIAEKIKEEKLNDSKSDIINVIKLTCKCLPCPECSQHATELINSVKLEEIRTKEELKLFLFNFHNHINKKLNKPIFNQEELNKYSKANINIIIKNFNIIFSGNSNIPQLMNSSFQRKTNLPIILKNINNILPNLNI